MTSNLRLSALAATMAAAFCLATLAPFASNEAVAQWGRSPGITHAYYGYGGNYYQGYGNGYNGYANTYGGYANTYGGYGNAVGGYGYRNYGYTGYGNGPYGYGAPAMYVYPSSAGYGYPNATPYTTYYRGLPYNGGSYGNIYVPNQATYYSPY